MNRPHRDAGSHPVGWALAAVLGWVLLILAVRAGVHGVVGGPVRDREAVALRSPTASDRGAGTSIRGRVFVEVGPSPEDLAPAPSCVVRVRDRASGRTVATGRCDPQGAYEVRATFDPRAVLVEIEVPGRLRALLDPIGDRLDDGGGVVRLRDVALGVAVEVYGRVLDPAGRPVADAVVEARPMPDLGEPLPWRIEADAGGRFAFTTLPAGPVALSARSRGYAGVELVAWAPDDDVVLVMDPLVRVEGRVRAPPEAQPSGQVVVRLAGASVWPPREVRAGADGRFSFEGVPGPWFALDARAAGPSGAWAAAPVDVDAADGAVPPVELRLEPAGALTVRVTDPAGRAVAGAYVSVRRGPLDALPRRARTDATGEVRLDALAAGAVEVAAHADGLLAAAPVPAKVVAGATRTVTVRLGAPGVLEGRVVDGAGRPVAGAEIVLRPDGIHAAAGAATALDVARIATAPATARLPVGSTPPPPVPAGGGFADARGVTAGDGTFRWVGLAPGRYTAWAVGPTGEVSEVQPVVIRGARTVRVVFVLTAGHPLRGRILDPNLRPVDGARLLLDHGLTAVSDATGTVAAGSFRGVVTGWVIADGYAPQRLRIPVEEDTEFEVVLEAADARLEVRVRGGNDRPVDGAHVRLSSQRPEPERSAATDLRGIVVFDGLARGPYAVEVDAPGYARWRGAVELVEPETFVEVALSPAVAVEVAVADAVSGRSVEGARVELRSADEAHVATTSSDGRARFEALAAPPEHVRVTAPGYVPSRLAVDGRGAGILHVTLERAGALEGVVVDDVGDPVAGARVEVRRDEGGTVATSTTDRVGRFRFDALPEGAVEVVAAPPATRPDLAPGTRRSDVLADRTTRGVDLRLERR
ncbi:MAG: carboxypeptidase regulatory-like domain-containing protein [Deltaproteobacteria bacterium]|nr:MAG: carboxypeptidase regulatory-like domain-containing protein [Deltaproteobacteria bacterium]